MMDKQTKTIVNIRTINTSEEGFMSDNDISSVRGHALETLRF